MYRKLSYFLIGILLISLNPTQSAFADQPVKLIINNKEIICDVAPQIINDRTMCPARYVAEILGATVSWDEFNNAVIINSSSSVNPPQIQQNKNIVKLIINGKEITCDVAPQIISGRTMCPARYIAEALGAKVSWDEFNNAVIINNSSSVNPSPIQQNKKIVERTYNSNGDLILDIDYDINVIDTHYRGNPMLNYDYMVDQTDTDGDGLTDYEEIHKYLTDPNNPDTDGDRTPDGDWNERREYTYTIDAVRELDKWYNPDSLKDTFEDIKIISDTGNKLKYESIIYPYAEDIVTGNSNWKEYQSNPKFEGLLKPRKTTNWDSKMQDEIIHSIPSDCKTDLDVVKFLVPHYFQQRTKPIPYDSGGPVDLWVDLRGDKTIIPKSNIEGFSNNRIDKNQSDEDFIKQIIFGKTMYYEKINGACTASATYMATILRAAGIPTRIIVTNRLLNTVDKTQGILITNLKNEKIKDQLLQEMKQGYMGHHYLEAYVGGRWVKINNDNTIFESSYIGADWATFCIKSDTNFDNADTPTSDIWVNHSYFPYYKLISLSDQYGKYYDEAKQPYFKKNYKYGLNTLNFDKIYLYGSKDFCSLMADSLGSNIIRRCSYGYSFPQGNAPFEAEWKENSLMVISNNTNYSILYGKIQSQISANEYHNLGNGDYRSFKVDNATVLIINY